MSMLQSYGGRTKRKREKIGLILGLIISPSNWGLDNIQVPQVPWPSKNINIMESVYQFFCIHPTVWLGGSIDFNQSISYLLSFYSQVAMDLLVFPCHETIQVSRYGYGYKLKYYKYYLYNLCSCTALYEGLFLKTSKRYRSHRAQKQSRSKEENFILKNRKNKVKRNMISVSYNHLRYYPPPQSTIQLVSLRGTGQPIK